MRFLPGGGACGGGSSGWYVRAAAHRSLVVARMGGGRDRQSATRLPGHTHAEKGCHNKTGMVPDTMAVRTMALASLAAATAVCCKWRYGAGASKPLLLQVRAVGVFLT